MTPEQYDGLMNRISDQIKETVNGKIDKITAKLDNYIKEDNEWKQTAEPVIRMGQNAKGASSTLLYLAGSIITLGGAIEIIRQFIKF